jgi:hypothetical protein
MVALGYSARLDIDADLKRAKESLASAFDKAFEQYRSQPYLGNRIKGLRDAISVVQGMLATADREQKKDEKRKEKMSRGRKRR